LLSERRGWGGVGWGEQQGAQRPVAHPTRTLPECSSGSPATEGWSSRGAVDGCAATVLWGEQQGAQRPVAHSTRTLPECSSGSPATEGWSSRGAVDGRCAPVHSSTPTATTTSCRTTCLVPTCRVREHRREGVHDRGRDPGQRVQWDPSWFPSGRPTRRTASVGRWPSRPPAQSHAGECPLQESPPPYSTPRFSTYPTTRSGLSHFVPTVFVSTAIHHPPNAFENNNYTPRPADQHNTR